MEQHEREVIDMVDFEWNQELFEEAKFEEGLELSKISEATGLSPDEIEALRGAATSAS